MSLCGKCKSMVDARKKIEVIDSIRSLIGVGPGASSPMLTKKSLLRVEGELRRLQQQDEAMDKAGDQHGQRLSMFTAGDELVIRFGGETFTCAVSGVVLEKHEPDENDEGREAE